MSENKEWNEKDAMRADYAWVKKVIASCENEDHMHYIPGILELFNKKWHWIAAWQELEEYKVLREIEIGIRQEP